MEGEEKGKFLHFYQGAGKDNEVTLEPRMKGGPLKMKGYDTEKLHDDWTGRLWHIVYGKLLERVVDVTVTFFEGSEQKTKTFTVGRVSAEHFLRSMGYDPKVNDQPHLQAALQKFLDGGRVKSRKEVEHAEFFQRQEKEGLFGWEDKPEAARAATPPSPRKISEGVIKAAEDAGAPVNVVHRLENAIPSSPLKSDKVTTTFQQALSDQVAQEVADVTGLPNIEAVPQQKRALEDITSAQASAPHASPSEKVAEKVSEAAPAIVHVYPSLSSAVKANALRLKYIRNFLEEQFKTLTSIEPWTRQELPPEHRTRVSEISRVLASAQKYLADAETLKDPAVQKDIFDRIEKDLALVSAEFEKLPKEAFLVIDLAKPGKIGEILVQINDALKEAYNNNLKKVSLGDQEYQAIAWALEINPEEVFSDSPSVIEAINNIREHIGGLSSEQTTALTELRALFQKIIQSATPGTILSTHAFECPRSHFRFSKLLDRKNES